MHLPVCILGKLLALLILDLHSFLCIVVIIYFILYLLYHNFLFQIALLAGRGYYGDSDEEATQVAKRNPHARLHEFEDESNVPSYVERRSELPESRYWNLLKALEEELALEAMSRQGPESDGMLSVKNKVFLNRGSHLN